MQDLTGTPCKKAISIIMKEDVQRKWKPFQLQQTIRNRTGQLYSESTITAALRKLKIGAMPPVDGSRAWTYSLQGQLF